VSLSQVWIFLMQQSVMSALSDLSSSDSESNASSHFDMGSPISIDTPDIHISSDISMPSNAALSPTLSDSMDSISDFKVLYCHSWKQHYRNLLNDILTNQVLHPAPPVPKSSQLHFLDHWRIHSPEHFRRKLRIEPETFDALVNLIKDNPIFHNNSNCPQLPVHLQLSIVLFCAGHYGNAASPEDTAQWAGISVGGVQKCTDRILIAILSFHDDAIHLPNSDEKEDAKNYIKDETCPEWCNGFLLADGSKFPLFQRPGLHGDAWFDKDGEYSIDCQVCFRSHALHP
jgi:hypothetical protein